VGTQATVTMINSPLSFPSGCPSSISVNTPTNSCQATVNYTTPTAAGCPTPTVSCSPQSGTSFNKGVTTVTCTASNAAGTADDATCTFTVTVTDNVAPV